MAVLLSTIRQWYCPNCKRTEQTVEAQPHTRFHICPKLANLTAPMLPAGTAAKVERRDRDDYVGKEIVQTDGNGRAVMSVVTTRDNGMDTIVFAPLARGREQ